MSIQPTQSTQPALQPQVAEVQKNINNVKITKTAKIVFAALAVCFASAAVIFISIGMVAPLSIIMGAAALACVVAATIFQFKNKSSHRVLPKNLKESPNLTGLSEEKKLDDDGFKVLVENLDEFLCIKDYNGDHPGITVFAKNLKKFPHLSDENKLKLAGMIIKNLDKNIFNYKALANNLGQFLKSSDENKLKLAGMILETEDQGLYCGLGKNLDKFLGLTDENKLKLANMLLEAKDKYSCEVLAKKLEVFFGLSKENVDKLADKLIISGNKYIQKALAEDLHKFTYLSNEKKVGLAGKLIISGDENSHKALARNLEKLPALPNGQEQQLFDKLLKLSQESDLFGVNFSHIILAENLEKFSSLNEGRKLDLAKNLLLARDQRSYIILAENLHKFPCLTLKNIETLIEKLKPNYNCYVLEKHFEKVVKQLAEIASKSGGDEQQELIARLEAIKSCLVNIIPKDKLKNIDVIIKSMSCKKIGDKKQLLKNNQLAEIKKKRETKKAIGEVEKPLESLFDGLKEICELGGE